MRPRTVIPTATPGAVGTRRAEVRTNPHRVTRIPLVRRNPVPVTQAKAPRVTRDRRAALPAPVAGGRRTRAADHRLSAEVVAEAGNPGRTVLVVRQAGAVVVAGAAAVAGEACGADANVVRCGLVKCLRVGNLEDRYVARNPQNRFCNSVPASGADSSHCR